MAFECLARFKLAFTTAALAKKKYFAEVAGVKQVTLNVLHKVNMLWPQDAFPETRYIFLQSLIHHCDCFQKR